jgi:hypothetical protein
MVSLKSLATGTQGVSLVCVSLRCVLRRAPFVPMMEAADLRNLHNGTVCGGATGRGMDASLSSEKCVRDRSGSWFRFSTFSLHVSSDNSIGSLTRGPYGWISCAC